jgi:formylglycine-generating enzyme required for sulfatase activity
VLTWSGAALLSVATACRPAADAPAPAFAPTVARGAPPATAAPAGMVWVPGGEFSMGSEAAADSLCERPGVTLDAQPIHRVAVDGFWMDATEVTNEQFAAFVRATSYRTVAEQQPDPRDFPGAPPELLVPGSAPSSTAPATSSAPAARAKCPAPAIISGSGR